jgi:hypothetical protein
VAEEEPSLAVRIVLRYTRWLGSDGAEVEEERKGVAVVQAEEEEAEVRVGETVAITESGRGRIETVIAESCLFFLVESVEDDEEEDAEIEDDLEGLEEEADDEEKEMVGRVLTTCLDLDSLEGEEATTDMDVGLRRVSFEVEEDSEVGTKDEMEADKVEEEEEEQVEDEGKALAYSLKYCRN